MAGRREESSERRTREKGGTGKMTVEEAGHLGGQRVRELVQEGKEREKEEGKGPEIGETTRSRSRSSERESSEESRQ
jgi:hypothetical protein